jgi:hypothetical protein
MPVRVVDTGPEAERMFRTFYDRPHKKHEPVRFGWPSSMQEAGEGKAVMYTSNKWKKRLDEYEDYKHVAEGSQNVYVRPGFLREWSRPSKRLSINGPTVHFKEPMPKHFAVLAPLLGVQLRLYERAGNGDLELPRGDKSLYEVTVAHGMLGGAHHPETGEPFLFVYTAGGGVHMLLTGTELDVKKDGIVG